MKRVTIFWRRGGITITAVEDENTGLNVAQRMVSGGFVVGRDNFWGRERELAINLGDASKVILEPMDK